MKVSYNWLKEFVDVTASPEEVASRLALSGTNIASIETGAHGSVIDAEITSNRPDCLGMLGIARETGAIYRLPLKTNSPKPAEFRVRAMRFCAACCKESNEFASAPCDCPVTAAWSVGLNPGLLNMLWNWGTSVSPNRRIERSGSSHKVFEFIATNEPLIRMFMCVRGKDSLCENDPMRFPRKLT